MNDVAREIAKLEEKKIQLPIGQIKEVLKCLKTLVKTDAEAMACFLRYLANKK